MSNIKKIFRSSVKRAVKSENPVNAQVYAQLVEKKAYELFERRGGQIGRDWDDWFEAERLVEKELITGK